MNILSIGNSFSQDAHRYLHQIAKSDGVNIDAYNLYIGGCSLSQHYRYMLDNGRHYHLEMNGKDTGFAVSLEEALLNRDWDVVTVQQASIKSFCYDTYQPYLDKLCEKIRLCVPKAKIAIHQTWAYEQDSLHLNERAGYKDHRDMFSDIKSAYKKAAKDVNADIIIPSGETLQRLIANGAEKVYRDTLHVSLGLGRYTLGLLWYSVLTGNDINNNAFCDFDEEISQKEIEFAKKSVTQVVTL